MVRGIQAKGQAMAARTHLPSADPTVSLAMAMVCSSPTPLLLLDGESKVIAASASFCMEFGIDPADVVGQPVFELGGGEWNVPQLRSLMEATTSGDAAIDSYEMDLRPAGQPLRTLILNVWKLAYDEPDKARVMVAIADVTQARALAKRDAELARDYALLMQETRHRIANSLQIIASVMMLNARRTSSEETRGQLRAAHSRVMSIADLQQQLAMSTDGDVAIHAYLSRLCETITASMIDDPKKLSIKVIAPDIRIDAQVSVSIGLIVTELVINALKHAFPDDAGGAIEVSYAPDGEAWTLHVSDDGVGMPEPHAETMAGLGTSIVQALAQQLGARVVVTAASPGTRVSIVRAALPAADLERGAPRQPVSV